MVAEISILSSVLKLWLSIRSINFLTFLNYGCKIRSLDLLKFGFYSGLVLVSFYSWSLAVKFDLWILFFRRHLVFWSRFWIRVCRDFEPTMPQISYAQVTKIIIMYFSFLNNKMMQCLLLFLFKGSCKRIWCFWDNFGARRNLSWI